MTDPPTEQPVGGVTSSHLRVAARPLTHPETHRPGAPISPGAPKWPSTLGRQTCPAALWAGPGRCHPRRGSPGSGRTAQASPRSQLQAEGPRPTVHTPRPRRHGTALLPGSRVARFRASGAHRTRGCGWGWDSAPLAREGRVGTFARHGDNAPSWPRPPLGPLSPWETPGPLGLRSPGQTGVCGLALRTIRCTSELWMGSVDPPQREILGVGPSDPSGPVLPRSAEGPGILGGADAQV